jgi:hypothetical protein
MKQLKPTVLLLPINWTASDNFLTIGTAIYKDIDFTLANGNTYSCSGVIAINYNKQLNEQFLTDELDAFQDHLQDLGLSLPIPESYIPDNEAALACWANYLLLLGSQVLDANAFETYKTELLNNCDNLYPDGTEFLQDRYHQDFCNNIIESLNNQYSLTDF